MHTKAILIQNGEVYAPEKAGKTSILVVNDKIASVDSNLDPHALEKLKIPFEVIDASGCVVTPGYIDPHEHLAGGSGEDGFASQTPSLHLCEIVEAGITTVVGCLGVDTITQNMAHLLAKVKAFNEEGITAYLYTGGYDVPPATITGSVRSDLMLVKEVIGAGEIAISDKRSAKPDAHELAKIIFSAYTGGKLTKKAGVCHFHLGEGEDELKYLLELMEKYEVLPESLYPTHIEKTKSLLKEGARFTHKYQMTVDIDTVEQDLSESLGRFIEHGGDLDFLTISSDASISSPRVLMEQFRKCVLETGIPLERLLPLITTNTARTLKLPNKARIKPGMDADLIVHRKDFSIRDVIGRGTLFVRNERPVREAFYLYESYRRFEVKGKKEIQRQ